MGNTTVIVTSFEDVILKVKPFENAKVRIIDSPEVKIIVPVSINNAFITEDEQDIFITETDDKTFVQE